MFFFTYIGGEMLSDLVFSLWQEMIIFYVWQMSRTDARFFKDKGRF
jgi:hypothetical protein